MSNIDSLFDIYEYHIITFTSVLLFACISFFLIHFLMHIIIYVHKLILFVKEMITSKKFCPNNLDVDIFVHFQHKNFKNYEQVYTFSVLFSQTIFFSDTNSYDCNSTINVFAKNFEEYKKITHNWFKSL